MKILVLSTSIWVEAEVIFGTVSFIFDEVSHIKTRDDTNVIVVLDDHTAGRTWEEPIVSKS